MAITINPDGSFTGGEYLTTDPRFEGINRGSGTGRWSGRAILGSMAGPAARYGTSYALQQMGSQGAAAGATGAGAAGAGSGGATAVGSVAMADGTAGVLMSDGTVVAAGEAGAAGGGGSASAAGAMGTAGIVAFAAITAYMAYKNYRAGKKAADGGALTSTETRSTVDPWYPIQQKNDRKLKRQMDKAGVPGEFDRIIDWGRKVTFLPGSINNAIFGKNFLGSSKSDDQLYRDRVRNWLSKNTAVINRETPEGGHEEWNIVWSDGGKFDIGRDGKANLPNNRRVYEVDSKDPLAAEVQASVDPLAAIITANDPKLRSSFGGYYTNAVLEGAKTPEQVERRIQELYLKHGITKEQAIATLDNMKAEEKVTEDEYNVWRSKVEKFAITDAEMEEFGQSQVSPTHFFTSPQGSRGLQALQTAIPRLEELGYDSPYTLKPMSQGNRILSLMRPATPPPAEEVVPTEVIRQSNITSEPAPISEEERLALEALTGSSQQQATGSPNTPIRLGRHILNSRASRGAASTA